MTDDAYRQGGWFRHHAVDLTPTRHPAFRRMLIGQSTAYIGSMLTQVAVPVQVYDLSQSSLEVGYVGLAGLVPILVFGLYGGAIADAVDRRLLYLWASVVAWSITLALLAQAALRVNNVPLILVLVAIQSGAFAVSSSTRGAIVPRIVDVDEIASANTLMFTAGNIGSVVGPLIAGVLVTQANGFVYAYTADAVLFTAALYSTFRLPAIPPGDNVSKIGTRAVLDGLRFIVTSPVLLMSFGIDIVAMVLALPRSLFPQVAAERYHGDVGVLYAAIAVGALVAGLSSGWVGRIRRQGVALTVAVVIWGVCVAVSGFSLALWLVLLLLAVAGGADLISSVYRQTILQTYAPDEMRGRMQGVFIAVVVGGPRLGDLRAGATAAATGPTFSWVAGGVACAVVAAIGGVVVRAFWRYDAQVAASQLHPPQIVADPGVPPPR